MENNNENDKNDNNNDENLNGNEKGEKDGDKKKKNRKIPYLENGCKPIRAPYFRQIQPSDRIPLRSRYFDNQLSK